MRRHLARNLGALGAALLTLTLSACGGGTTTGATGGAVVTAPTAAATDAATATTQPTVNTTTLPAGCSGMAKAAATRVGDLVITKVTKALDYPDWTIPPGTPNQPLQIQRTSTTGSPVSGSVEVGSHGTNDGYFAFEVCNASTTQAHTLKSVSIRVASFTPYSGPLTVWAPCEDGTYDAQTQSAFNGGCGGGYGTNEYLQADFPANAGVGDIVTAQVASTSPEGPNDPNPYPKLPLSLAPGHMVGMAASLTVPTTPGSYAFAFGLAVDSTSAAYFSTSSSEIYAPITQHWTGQNCTTAAMKAQIPAASTTTQYICPPAS